MLGMRMHRSMRKIVREKQERARFRNAFATTCDAVNFRVCVTWRATYVTDNICILQRIVLSLLCWHELMILGFIVTRQLLGSRSSLWYLRALVSRHCLRVNVEEMAHAAVQEVLPSKAAIL